jgi:hypothetical protein
MNHTLICQHCGKECKNSNSHTNHERTCPKNPNRVYKNGMLGKKGSNQFAFAEKHGLTKPVHSAKGRPGRLLTNEQKERLSVIAKERGLGGYQPLAGRSKKFYVLDSFGKKVCLQSSFELRCSELLNELKIKWIRPTALKYDNKNYFADFYLPEFNLYLDPKNNYKAKLDQTKIDKVKEQNNVKIVVLLEEHLTLDYIKSLCS